MLHIINKSPFQNGALESCLRFLNDDDEIILIEDGVYAAMPDTSKSDLISSVISSHKVYVLEADIAARSIDKVIDNINTADYEKFVDLIEAQPTQSWL